MSAGGDRPSPSGLRASLLPVATTLKERASVPLAEVRLGIAELKAPVIARPPEEARLRRFLYGFGLPARILRALLADPAARRRYLRVLLTQLAIILVVGVCVAALGKSRADVGSGFGAGLARLIAVLSAFWATLGVIEWIVVALSRDYHDQLGREASLRSGAPPEDPERRPRVRLDLAWLRRKLFRKARGFVVIAIGLPIVYLASLTPFAGKVLSPLLGVAWTTYWIGVFTAGRTGFAWRTEGAPGARDPWFMRFADRATQGTLLGRLGLPRLYVIVWRNVSAGLFAPARELEAHPYELFGIAAFRALLVVPGTYLFFRPILPVASAHVLVASEGEAASASVEPPRLSSYPNTFPRPAALPVFEPRVLVGATIEERSDAEIPAAITAEAPEEDPRAPAPRRR